MSWIFPILVGIIVTGLVGFLHYEFVNAPQMDDHI